MKVSVLLFLLLSSAVFTTALRIGFAPEEQEHHLSPFGGADDEDDDDLFLSDEMRHHFGFGHGENEEDEDGVQGQQAMSDDAEANSLDVPGETSHDEAGEEEEHESTSTAAPGEEHVVVITDPAKAKAALKTFGKIFSSMATAFGAPRGAVIDQEHAVQHFFTQDVYNLMNRMNRLKHAHHLSDQQKLAFADRIHHQLAEAMQRAFGSQGFHFHWSLPVEHEAQRIGDEEEMDDDHEEDEEAFPHIQAPDNGKMVVHKWMTTQHGLHCVHSCKAEHNGGSSWQSCSTHCS